MALCCYIKQERSAYTSNKMFKLPNKNTSSTDDKTVTIIR